MSQESPLLFEVPTPQHVLYSRFVLSCTATSFLSEAQFSTELPKTLDPLFKFHETIAKATTKTAAARHSDGVADEISRVIS
ncbi:hypothetical protein D9C73_008242 [Collichthys lucidus]|uniref:Uncharacterized protein n=1 Tax=Collichthys lucidus TaxID=240159 RepID=A0A4U5UJ04_COLLU|nr:hypothetical protein D9C73_008242 [Collichthys lucidus]